MNDNKGLNNSIFNLVNWGVFGIKKEGQLNLISLIVVLFSGVLFVGAVAYNTTNSTSYKGSVDSLGNVSDNVLLNLKINPNESLIDNNTIGSNITAGLDNLTNGNASDENITGETSKTIRGYSDNVSNNILEKPKLATVVNGKNIFDDSYTPIYLGHYKHFSDVDFKDLTPRENSALLKAGNVETKIEGFVLNNKKYAIHLVACNREKGTCNFRINGAVAKDLSPNGISTFDLDENYAIKINSIKIDYCDNRRICDYYYQAYDLVEIEVMER